MGVSLTARRRCGECGWRAWRLKKLYGSRFCAGAGSAPRRRARPAAALGADPLEAWRKVFPTVRGKSLGEDGHFLQSEAPDEVNRELLAFLSEGAP